MTLQEVAHLLEQPIETVQIQLRQARRKLADKFDIESGNGKEQLI